MRAGLRPCLEPGCPTLVAHGRCPTHTHERNVARDSRANRDTRWVYKDRRWQGTRRAVLRRDRWCVVCRTAPSTDVDHVTPLRQLLAQGMDPFDPSVCQGLCHRDHSAKTTRELRASGRW